MNYSCYFRSFWWPWIWIPLFMILMSVRNSLLLTTDRQDRGSSDSFSRLAHTLLASFFAIDLWQLNLVLVSFPFLKIAINFYLWRIEPWDVAVAKINQIISEAPLSGLSQHTSTTSIRARYFLKIKYYTVFSSYRFYWVVVGRPLHFLLQVSASG